MLIKKETDTKKKKRQKGISNPVHMSLPTMTDKLINMKKMVAEVFISMQCEFRIGI